MPEGAEFVWAAFWRLTGDRPQLPMTYTARIEPAGMGAVAILQTDLRPGPIPFAAIDRYARRYGIEGDGFDLLVALLAPLDREYLAIEAERARARMAR